MKLSAKMDRTADAVQRLQDENFRMKGQVARMEEEMFRAESKKWEGAGSVLIFKEGLEADSVRKLADAVMNTCEGCCAVFSRNEDGSYKYAMGEIDGDLRQYTKEMNAALNGRGGGKPFFVQGSVQATEDEIRNFFEK
jgi:alanyl-tRNA synthetase